MNEKRAKELCQDIAKQQGINLEAWMAVAKKKGQGWAWIWEWITYYGWKRPPKWL
jgi:hypothetical protein